MLRAQLQPSSSWSIWVCLKMSCTPLYPMVLLIIIPIKWLFHWEYTLYFPSPVVETPRSTMEASPQPVESLAGAMMWDLGANIWSLSWRRYITCHPRMGVDHLGVSENIIWVY